MNKLPKVTHYGTVHFGDVAMDAVVLEDGSRGFIQSQLMQVIGLRKKAPSTQIAKFLGDFSPKALEIMEKSGYAVLMPHAERFREPYPGSVWWHLSTKLPATNTIENPTPSRIC